MSFNVVDSITGKVRAWLSSTNGKLHVSNADAPTSVQDDIATSTTALVTAQVMPTGTTHVAFTNLGEIAVPAIEIIRIAFGNNAITAVKDTGIALYPGATRTLRVPSGATHFSVVSESGTPALAWGPWS